MHKVLVSACLLGASVRYHGGDARITDPILQRWAAEGRIVSVCPEVAGGLPVPRPPAEIRRLPADSQDQSKRRLVVVTREGRDVTGAFVAGADQAVEVARRERIRAAILKDGSPSCATSAIYDGTFSGTRVAGRGVTAAALEAAGVRVFSETDIRQADVWLAELDEASQQNRQEIE